MTDVEFNEEVASLRRLAYREDYGRTLCSLFISCDAHHRDVLRSLLRSKSVHAPDRWKDPTDYDRTYMPHEEQVRSSLINIAMEGFGDSGDYREDLRRLGFLYNGANVLGLDGDILFEQTAQLAEPDVAKLIRDFVARPADGKSLRSWGLRLVQTPTGPWIENSVY